MEARRAIALESNMTTTRKFLAAIFVVLVALGAITAAEASGASPGPDVTTTATVKGAHIGATNPGFTAEQTCPYEGWGWHFVLPGNQWEFVAITATFANAGAVSSPVVFHPTAKHAYLWTPGPDTLVGATATVAATHRPGQVPDAPVEFNLSHVCWDSTPFTTTTTTPQTTTTVPGVTTTTPGATTTVPGGTTTPEGVAPTTASAAPVVNAAPAFTG